MASRVNVGRIQYNMPDVYEMSKEAYEGSLKGTLGRNIGRVGEAVASRMAAEKFAKIQRDRNNFAEANKLAKSGDYSKANYDEGYNLEFGEITDEDKKYDPFKEDDSIISDDAIISDDIRYLGDELYV